MNFDRLLGPGEFPEVPALRDGEEVMRLAVRLTYTKPRVVLFYAFTFSFPDALASRYRDLPEAPVLVVHDRSQRDAFAFRLGEPPMDIEYPPGVHDGPNMTEPPAKPFPLFGSLQSEAFRGGNAIGSVAFESPSPTRGPCVFLHVVLENYFSNALALDLLEGRVTDLGAPAPRQPADPAGRRG
jgi:hypothetical protein